MVGSIIVKYWYCTKITQHYQNVIIIKIIWSIFAFDRNLQ